MNTEWNKRKDIQTILLNLKELYNKALDIKIDNYQDKIKMTSFVADNYTLLGHDSNLISKDIICIPFNINNVPCEWVYTKNSNLSKRLLYIHGGAFMGGNLESHKHIASYLAEKTNSCVLIVDYQKAPENPFPTAINNCFDVYQYLLNNSPLNNTYSENVFIVGDSAGGNLTMSVSLKIRNSGLPLPKALLPVSPLLDFSGTNESTKTMNGIDPVLESSLLRNRLPLIYLWGKEVLKVNSDLELKNLEDKFLSNNDLIKDPFVSPYYADLTGLPPVFLNVGEIEILRDDSVKFYEKGINYGLDIKVKVWKDMIHVFIAFLGVIPEALECLNEMSEFINKYSDT